METAATVKRFFHRLVLGCCFLALYLVFAGAADFAEVMAGAVAAALAVPFAMRLHDRFPTILAIRPRWLLRCLLVIPALFQETWLLGRALYTRFRGKHAAGRFLEYPYRQKADDTHGAARFAVMAFGVCVTPNSYLVGYDPRRQRALVRQLVGRNLSGIDRAFLELP